MATVRRVEVDMVAIQSMFVRGGDIYKFAVKVSDDVRDAARRRIHNRSRTLWRSVSARRHTLPLGVKFTVGAFAKHALIVEEGTPGGGAEAEIVPLHQFEPMVLYAGDRFVPAKYIQHRHQRIFKVKGQKGIHYLRNGLRAGLLRNNLRPGP